MKLDRDKIEKGENIEILSFNFIFWVGVSFITTYDSVSVTFLNYRFHSSYINLLRICLSLELNIGLCIPHANLPELSVSFFTNLWHKYCICTIRLQLPALMTLVWLLSNFNNTSRECSVNIFYNVVCLSHQVCDETLKLIIQIPSKSRLVFAVAKSKSFVQWL